MFYFADGMAGTIYVFDQDGSSGTLTNRRALNGTFDRGVPGGSAIDINGLLWNAHWGGSCVVHFEPDGSVDRIVEMPVTNPTSCAFGGPDMRTLIVTSSRDGLSPDHLGDAPMEGAIFAIETEIPGPITDRFTG